MEDNDQTRQLNPLAAALLTALAGVIGGAAGVMIALGVVRAIAALVDAPGQFSGAVYVVFMALPFIGGPLGAIGGAWLTGRLIDKFEKRPLSPKFRDNRAGGVLTLVAKIAVWITLLMFIWLSVFLTTRR